MIKRATTIFFAYLALLLLGSGESVSAQNTKKFVVDCSFFAGLIEIEDLLNHTNCGTMDSAGLITLNWETLALIPFNKAEDDPFKPSEWENNHSPQDLWCLPTKVIGYESGNAYFNKDGKGRMADSFDTGCTWFKNGVSITYIEGKAAFFDKSLNIVKQTNYLLVENFYKHLAKVCTKMPTKKYGPYNEHFEWIGGKCGYIDESFKIIVPIKYTYQDAPRLTGGKYDGEEPDEWELDLVKFLHSKITTTKSPIEAIFPMSGCKIDNCAGIFNDIPSHYDKNHWIREMEFRLEDQTRWRGRVVFDRKHNMFLNKLERI